MAEPPIVLTERREHVLLLADKLAKHCKNIITLFGTASAKLRRETMEKLQAIPADVPLVIVATGKYVGEGFDLRGFNTRLAENFGEGIYNNGDYYSMLVHMCQKSEYDFDEIVEKQDTFFEDYLKDVLKEYDGSVYKGLKVKLIFDNKEEIKFFEDCTVTNITFRLDYSE